MRAQGRVSGFTLLELLVTIAVAGVLLAIAVPSFKDTIISSRLTAASNSFASSLAQARMEAIRRNASVQFCGSSSAGNGADTLGSACAASAGAVYALSNGASAMIQDAPSLPAGVSLGPTGIAALRYGSQGTAQSPTTGSLFTGLVADIYSDRISTNNRRCVYIAAGGGVVTTCKYTNLGGGCPNSEPSPCQP